MAQQQPQQARPWNPDFKHTDRERWICIYPAYMNSRKTVTEGRRLPKDKCVDNPTYNEIKDVLIASGFSIGIENKVYPRELDHRDPKVRGRIRVQLRDENDGYVMPEFKTRKAVLEVICEKIPKLKSRIQGASSQPAPAQQQTSAKSKKGRKGK
ncbi:signal recognition particle 19 kDa protein-like isoform X2 [Ostrea edulis]|uniref:signal recognition particle 19 kDa protein-like isoform X2 n=1 Tax=Ostrea edulis TaxID=37623 RepID=UPI0020948578|nr:signal recognition particle 19 kDa protein-like isoform X2 [Ostrea edulis]